MAGDLRNKPEREEAFKDWGLGMFVHWSFDSQLGSVISHSMDYASRDYLDRYVNELPKTFHPRKFDPDEWMELAKLTGAKYMVLTAKHHNGFCMWDTKTTDFNIMNTPYGKDIVRQYVDACRRHGLKVGFYYSPEDFAFHYERDIPARAQGTGESIMTSWSPTPKSTWMNCSPTTGRSTSSSWTVGTKRNWPSMFIKLPPTAW